ncbi:MAG: D-2-hydroxyacid dehydrogenase [Selenomonadaceae bacterium]|nr:D-2-hydroxyacid dehydrogenase [Selenomonadaceae bacterium]
MKIVVLDGDLLSKGEAFYDVLKTIGEYEYYADTDYGNEDEIVQRIGDADAVFINKVPMTESVMKRCPNLKFIGETATGYNNVDVAAAKKLGVTVSNVPTYGTMTVAQFAMALLLEICNSVDHHAAEVAKGRWIKEGKVSFWDIPSIELAGKTLGIIGYGHIGHAFAAMAKAMGMNIIASHPRKMGQKFDLGMYVSLEELLQQADVISLHCPLTEETKEIINEKTIQQMQDGVIIINTSRGQLIDEKALAAALNLGKVLAAGLDVVSTEPMQPDNPLLQAKNCYITPHMAWSAKAARQRLIDTSVENLKAFMAGMPINVVS